MKYSHLFLLFGVLLLAGYTRGTSQSAPKKISAGLDEALLQRYIVYPKAALKGKVSGSVEIRWFPATRREPVRVAIRSITVQRIPAPPTPPAVNKPGNGKMLVEAVRRALRAYDPTISIMETSDSTLDTGWLYVVSFKAESVHGKRVTLIEVDPELSIATPEGSSPETSAEEHYPDMDEFVQVDKEPVWDQSDLQRRLKYPELAQRNNIEGAVLVRVLIDTHGNVAKTHIDRSDHPSLNGAALEAVMHTSFTPAMKDGKPIAIWVSMPFTFKLSN